MKANVESKNSNQTSTMKKIITERIIRTSSTSMPKIKKSTQTNIELH